jgi:uncharacterized protein (TIGR04255 family)
MPLIFPPVDHVSLRNPPLREVICQVRFPPILMIADETPKQFQASIRDRFPDYQTHQEVEFQVALGQSIKSLNPKPQIHRFLDRDQSRTVSLGLDFYAISTTAYEGWEAFAEDLRFVTEQVISIYKVPYSTRIGLRYINALNTQSTGMHSFDPEVLEMLRPELTLLPRSKEVQQPSMALTQIRAGQEEGEFTFWSGIIQEQGEVSLRSFMLDFDRYIEEDIELDVASLLDRCDRYHAEIYSAFRWCIIEDKLAVFGPASGS